MESPLLTARANPRMHMFYWQNHGNTPYEFMNFTTQPVTMAGRARTRGGVPPPPGRVEVAVVLVPIVESDCPTRFPEIIYLETRF
jgi:hypothetical protein